jgi:hypothetical protein
VELTCQTQKEGRHVGLNFYDLLIEALTVVRVKTRNRLSPILILLVECGGTHRVDL